MLIQNGMNTVQASKLADIIFMFTADVEDVAMFMDGGKSTLNTDQFRDL